MDHDAILTSVKKTNRLVILEEAWPFASVSSEITYRSTRTKHLII